MQAAQPPLDRARVPLGALSIAIARRSQTQREQRQNGGAQRQAGRASHDGGDTRAASPACYYPPEPELSRHVAVASSFFFAFLQRNERTARSNALMCH
jgi:hypothetical protein